MVSPVGLVVGWVGMQHVVQCRTALTSVYFHKPECIHRNSYIFKVQ